MNLKAKNIINVYTVLEKLANKDVNFSTACIIAKNIKELATPMQIFEDKRQKLLEEYAVKNEDGTIKTNESGNVELDNPAKYAGTIDELLSSSVNVEITKIDKDMLSDIKLSAIDILALDEAGLL